MDIRGHVAWVTGAGSGLGAATARRLASQGARVAVVDRDVESAQAVANEIEGLAVAVDVSDLEAVESAYSEACSRLEQVPRIVVNCAGIGTAARVVGREGKLSVDIFERTLRVNLIGSYIVLSVASRAMQSLEPVNDDGERGIVINTSSVAYQDGQFGQTAYAASKGGIASLTLPAARELAQFGIRVAAIAPGLFETAMTDGLPDEVREKIISNIPFPKRLGHAEEYAIAAEHMVRNPSINGTVLRLDAAVRLPQR